MPATPPGYYGKPIGRSSNTLVYTPAIQVLVATDTGVWDLSDDVGNGQVRRVINAVSQFSCILNNLTSDGKYKYTGVLKRMDRITVSFSRVGKWVQVFTGYLDSVPVRSLYKSTCQITATCTLKRLMHTWWDPLLPESQDKLLDQRLYVQGTPGGGSTQINGQESDTGIGKMLANVLFTVGNWNPGDIKIQNVPAGFLNLALEMSVAQEAENAKHIMDYRATLGMVNGSGATNIPTATTPLHALTGIKPPGKNQNSYTIAELVTICRAVGFTGDNIATAVAIADMNSGGNPSSSQDLVPPIDLPGVVTSRGPTVQYAGLFGLVVGGVDAGAVSGKISSAEALDALTNAKLFFQLTNQGTDFVSNQTIYKHDIFAARATSAPWISSYALAKAAMLKPDDTSILIFGSAVTGAVSTSAVAPGTVTVTVASYNNSASTAYLMGIYGNSKAAIEANLVNITFQGQTVRVHKLAAAAFLKVDQQITAQNTGYKIRMIGTYEYRTMNNGNANAPLSWHSFGIAIDINWDTNGSIPAGVGPASTDLPAIWISIFKQNGFEWGGDWSAGSRDYMHFEWNGGGTYTGLTTTNATGQTVLTGLGQSATDGVTGGSQVAINNPFQEAVFTYLFLNNQDRTSSTLLDGAKAPVNDVQLLSTVQAICSASMRSFMSGPDGSFIAFYPDYFGVNGTAPVVQIEDLELLNYSIDVSDDSLATDVFVAGGINEPYSPAVTAVDWLHTAGVVNITQPGVMKLLLGIEDSKNDPNYSPTAIYARFGLRPIKAEYPAVATGVMEYLQALTLFQQKWAAQYSTNVTFTFMPEIYPGMRLLIKSDGLTVFVESVTHTFDFNSGFQTSATISSPSSTNGGFAGLNIGRL